MKKLLFLFIGLLTALNASAVTDAIIYYTTTDNTAINLSSILSDEEKCFKTFGANYLTSSFTNGKGEIHFSSAPTKIGDKAFKDCTTLKTIEIPAQVTEIGTQAFYGCENLVKVDLSTTRTKNILTSAFDGCIRLEYLTLPSTLETIHNYAFRGIAIEELVIPNSVTAIGPRAFADCCYLMNAVLGSGFGYSKGTIFAGIFSGCSMLFSITSLSTDPADIVWSSVDPNEKTFANIGRDGLTCTLRVPKEAYDLYHERHYDDLLPMITIEASQIEYTTTDGNFVWPNGCFNIGDEYVSGGARIASNKNINGHGKICFNREITEIKTNAFKDKSTLKTIVIPEKVTRINASAFSGCTNLSYVNTGYADLEIIEPLVFENCSSLTYIHLPNTLTRIERQAFMGSGLTSITMNNSVSYETFKDCRNLTTVTLGTGVHNIGFRAFQGAENLKVITMIEDDIYCSYCESGDEGGVAGARDAFYGIPRNQVYFRVSECALNSCLAADGYSKYFKAISSIESTTFGYTVAGYDQPITLYYEDSGRPATAEQIADIFGSDLIEQVKVEPNHYQMIFGETIAGVGDKAFYGQDHITSMTLPAEMVFVLSKHSLTACNWSQSHCQILWISSVRAHSVAAALNQSHSRRQ